MAGIRSPLPVVVQRTAFVGLFLLVLVSQLGLALLPIDGNHNLILEEKRQLTERPALHARDFVDGRIQRFPVLFEKYFNDSLTFRKEIIHFQSLLSFGLFGSSPVPDKVLVGHDGWLFYCDKSKGDEMGAYLGMHLLDPTALSTIRSRVIALERWLAARGIQFVLMIAPNKSTIYSEWLPRSYAQKGSPHRTDQVIALLQQAGVPVLDLRPTLMAHKGERLQYYKTDSHWNYLGAFYGYEQLMARLRLALPAARQRRLEDFRIEEKPRRGGDLADMINLGDRLADSEVLLTPSYARHIERKRIPDQYYAFDTVNQDLSSAGTRIVVYHDSFFLAMEPFLYDSFSRVISFYSRQIDRALIEREKPQVVLVEIVEREIADLANLR